MPATESQAITETPPRRKFTRDEVYQLVDSGVFAGQRFELIDGDIIDKMGQNPPHFSGIQAIYAILLDHVGFARVRAQAPIETEGADRERSEPEPDLAAVTIGDPSRFRQRHPRGAELVLAVEVSDTTLRPDLTIKRDLYARSAVREYWVLDLNGRRLIVHRKPVAGDYMEVTSLSEDQSVDFEGSSIPVSKMLP